MSIFIENVCGKCIACVQASPMLCCIQAKCNNLFYFVVNRIYNKMLDSDWFFARLFVTKLARDHVGVQLQPFVIRYL